MERAQQRKEYLILSESSLRRVYKQLLVGGAAIHLMTLDDDLLGDMHRDRKTITDALRGNIAEQQQERRDASQELIKTLEEHIKELKDQENRLQPQGGMDVHRDARWRVEERRQAKEERLAQEKAQLVRDLGPSLAEDRLLTREELEEEQQYKLINETFYDS